MSTPSTEGAPGRVHGYRQMAEHARALANASELPSVKEAYMRSAERWTTLADLVELGGGLPPPPLTRATGWRTRSA